GGENHNVTRAEREPQFVVFDLRQQSQWNSANIKFRGHAVAQKQWQCASGIGNGELAESRVVNSKMHGDKTRIQPRGKQAAIHKTKHFRGAGFAIDDKLPQDAYCQRAVERCRRTLSRNISHGDSQAAHTVGEQVVEIPAEFSRGDVGGGKIQSGYIAGAAGQELALYLPRGLQVSLHAKLRLARLFK